MSNKLSYDILRQLPKAELHCHLDGFVRPETVIELAAEQHVTLPTTDLNELRKLMTAPLDCPDLPTYLQCFDIVNLVMQEPYAIKRIFYEACEDAVKDGISYIELRFAPALHTKNGYSYSEILEAAIDGCILSEQKLDITPRIICCAMRQMSPEINQQIAEICWRYKHRYVVAFDLAGPEYGFPPQKHVKAFRTIRMKSVSVTIHAGEAYGAESVNQAISCSAQRIGHGTRSVEDEHVFREIINRRIPLEICMSSNVQTKAVKTIESHPVRKMFDSGVRTCICTDNPTVSGVTLTNEYMILQDKFNFTIPDILKVIDYGFRAAFVQESLIHRLRVEALLKCIKVLQENNIDISSLESLNPYYAKIGVTIPPKFVPPTPNPPLTVEFIQKLPKCDLDCRFIGSVPLNILYSFYSKLSDEEKKSDRFNKFPSFDSLESFSSFIHNEPSHQFHRTAKQLSYALLQSEVNIRQAAKAIMKSALEDNVTYMELTCCPVLHTSNGLTASNVVELIVDEINLFTKETNNKLLVKLILSADISLLDPLAVQEVAELCVKYHDSGNVVVGFATTSGEISFDNFPYYQHTFEFLRHHFIPVTIFAGDKDMNSVNTALVCGFANRLSGGFKIPESESLLNEVTSHNVAILVGTETHRMESNVANWHKSPQRFFFDFGLHIALCSLNHAFSTKTRAEKIFHLAQASGFDTLDVLRIMDNTFAAMTADLKVAHDYQEKFWNESLELLKANGYKRFMNYTYIKT